MPRRLRLHQPGGFYHATLRGNHQRDIFVAETDRFLLNHIVARAIDNFGAQIHAYCWMSNHLHFLIQVGSEPLANPMRQIAGEFARAMQLKLETTGHFFERRYHAILVDADSYLLELIRYIHLNPVRAGIVRDPAHYRWSSHHAYVGSRVEPWVTTEFALRMFAGDSRKAIAAYREFLACDSAEPWTPAKADGNVNTAALRRDEFTARAMRSPTHPRPSQDLPELIAEACRRFDIDAERLNSPLRDPYTIKVRAWIAHQAKLRRVATLAAVARALGRDEATLRYAIRAYPGDVE